MLPPKFRTTLKAAVALREAVHPDRGERQRLERHEHEALAEALDEARASASAQ